MCMKYQLSQKNHYHINEYLRYELETLNHFLILGPSLT